MKPSIDRLSLKSLRDRMSSLFLETPMVDDDGDVHTMIYVQRVTLPASCIAEGVPSRDLNLGGFLVDKYQASAIELIGGIQKAASRPLVEPEQFDEDTEAVVERRQFGGMPCRALGPTEWGHIAWIVRWLGHEIYGNTASGRDARDDDAFASYGEVVGAGPYTTGGGLCPPSWFHNGQPQGISDLIGNWGHLLLRDERLAPGAVLVERPAVLSESGGINDSETNFEIRNDLEDRYPLSDWPATDGLLLIGDERIVYATLTDNEDGTATLAGCTRGAYGTTPAAHDEDADLVLERWHAVLPGGYTGRLDGAIDDTQTEVDVDWAEFGHGSRQAEPAEGDVVCLDNEDLLIESIDGATVTVQRGYNGTTPAAHDDLAIFTRYPTTMTRLSQGYVRGYATGTMHTHVDLEELYLPRETQTDVPTEGPKRTVTARLHPPAAGVWYMRRGGDYSDGAEDMATLRLVTGNPLGATRAVLSQ